ncbi:EAL domain-containing protein [Thermopolyspora sp. NPDC052614]|uniref:EAL domain-containing protein n=1 Tax=Thermopolyspora sp. NPDC052614 TaxID=3155682 RepID=UPI00342E224A
MTTYSPHPTTAPLDDASASGTPSSGPLVAHSLTTASARPSSWSPPHPAGPPPAPPLPAWRAASAVAASPAAGPPAPPTPEWAPASAGLHSRPASADHAFHAFSPSRTPDPGVPSSSPGPDVQPAKSTVAFQPVVDLDTGGVLAVEAMAGDVGDIGLLATIDAVYGTARIEAPLPLLVSVPVEAVANGSAALAPLHEALRATNRRPREVTLVIKGGVGASDRRALITGIDGLRAIGYLIAFGDVGVANLPLDLVADASPYVLVLSPDMIARIPRDPRRSVLTESLVGMAKSMGAHLLAPGVYDTTQLAALRRWGIRLAQGPLLAPADWRPSHGRVHVPLPVPEEAPAAPIDLGPRVQEFLMPAVTLPEQATAEEVVSALGTEPSITSVVLVDEYQRPQASVDRSRFLLAIAGRYGHALHGRKPAKRLADPPRTVPKTTPAIAAMRVAGQDAGRVYDDLVVIDEVGRCMGVVHISDLIRHVTDSRADSRAGDRPGF